MAKNPPLPFDPAPLPLDQYTPPPEPPFSNSMNWDNEPTNSDGPATGDGQRDPLPSPQDGVNNASGLQTYPLPKDPHAP